MFNCFIIAQNNVKIHVFFGPVSLLQNIFPRLLIFESSASTIFKKVSLSILGTLKTKKFNREFNLMRYENKAEKS